jgi:hypothetical protein
VHVTGKGQITNAGKLLAVKPEWKMPLERPRRRCDGNIKLYFKQVTCDGVGSINMALNRRK